MHQLFFWLGLASFVGGAVETVVARNDRGRAIGFRFALGGAVSMVLGILLNVQT